MKAFVNHKHSRRNLFVESIGNKYIHSFFTLKTQVHSFLFELVFKVSWPYYHWFSCRLRIIIFWIWMLKASWETSVNYKIFISGFRLKHYSKWWVFFISFKAKIYNFILMNSDEMKGFRLNMFMNFMFSTNNISEPLLKSIHFFFRKVRGCSDNLIKFIELTKKSSLVFILYMIHSVKLTFHYFILSHCFICKFIIRLRYQNILWLRKLLCKCWYWIKWCSWRSKKL